MSIAELGKRLKRKLIRRITGNSVGKKNATNGNIRKILISRPNHRLGNLLLITPLVQEVSHLFPGCQIDLFVSGHHAPIIFRNYENIDRILCLPRKPGKDLLQYLKVWLQLRKVKYDLAINAEPQSSSGRLSVAFARGRIRFVSEENLMPSQLSQDEKHKAKQSVYALRRFLASLPMIISEHSIPLLDLKLSVAELEKGRQQLQEILPGNKKIIGIFTNATGSKCYSGLWWMHFYELLKSSFPEYQIVEILPFENTSRIHFQAPSLYSTHIREMGAVMASFDAFISGDCGVMHLATASQTPTLGLFNLDRLDFYEPCGNNSSAVNTNLKSSEEIIGLLKLKVLRENLLEKKMFCKIGEVPVLREPSV